MNSVHSGTSKDKTNALITGIYYLVAAVAAMMALKFYEPLLYHPQWLLQGHESTPQIILGVFLELVTVGTVAGTAIMLYPYLRKFNESMALGYLCFRILEAILILIGILSVLSLLTLSKTYSHAVTPDVAMYQTSGSMLKAIHDWTFILGPNFMLGINTVLYSLIFYRSKLIPRRIALMGLIGAVLIWIASILEICGIIEQVSIEGFLFAIPVFAYEMTLAIWLILKGFNLNTLYPSSSNR